MNLLLNAREIDRHNFATVYPRVLEIHSNLFPRAVHRGEEGKLFGTRDSLPGRCYVRLRLFNVPNLRLRWL